MAHPYYWWQGDSVEELTRQLVAHPGCRFEVRPQEGGGALMFVHPAWSVVAADGGGGGINDSHVCPPQC